MLGSCFKDGIIPYAFHLILKHFQTTEGSPSAFIMY